MVKYYTPDFKLEAVKRVQRTGEPVSKVAEELGINPNTLQGWMKRIREHPEGPFPGSGRLSPEDDRLRKLERENRNLREEVEILTAVQNNSRQKIGSGVSRGLNHDFGQS